MLKIKIELDFLDKDFLRPHEETILSKTNYVMENISRSRILRRPLIIDKNSFIIIDGHHRYEALVRLGVRKIPVILVDYINDESISLDKWIRIYVMDRSIDKFDLRRIFLESTDIIKKSNIVYIRNTDDGRDDILNFYRGIKIFETMYSRYIIDVKYKSSNKNVSANVKSSDNMILVIDPPNLSKKLVIDTALNKERLPPKSTRHITILKRIELRFTLNSLMKLSLRHNDFINSLSPYLNG